MEGTQTRYLCGEQGDQMGVRLWVREAQKLSKKIPEVDFELMCQPGKAGAEAVDQSCLCSRALAFYMTVS